MVATTFLRFSFAILLISAQYTHSKITVCSQILKRKQPELATLSDWSQIAPLCTPAGVGRRVPSDLAVHIA